MNISDLHSITLHSCGLPANSAKVKFLFGRIIAQHLQKNEKTKNIGQLTQTVKHTQFGTFTVN